jgi:RHS repeat-associated protein
MAKANPFRFSTKYEDDETDLFYYGHRYYNARTGRWIGRDPIGEKGGRNIYAYVANNPTIFTDAFGLEIFPGGVPLPDPGNGGPYSGNLAATLLWYFYFGGGGDLVLTDANSVGVIRSYVDPLQNTMLQWMKSKACSLSYKQPGGHLSIGERVSIRGGTLNLLTLLLNDGHFELTADWTSNSDCTICLRNIRNEFWDEIMLKDHFRLPPDWDRHVVDDVVLLYILRNAGIWYRLGMYQEYTLYVRWTSPDVCFECKY